MILNDYHMHSEISPDGKSTMKEMCKSAIEKGMKEVAFTDHYECYSYGIRGKWHTPDYLKRYFEHINECKEIYADKLIIRTGIELGQSHLNLKEASNVYNDWEFDFVLGSIHKLANIDISWINYNMGNYEYICETYYNNLLELTKYGEYDCIAHFDYVKKHCAKAGMPDCFDKYQLLIEECLKNIIIRGKGIELNTSCMGGILEETMPDIRILKMYKELGGTIITVGSDAHEPKRVGYGFDKVKCYILEAGLQHIAVFKNHKPYFQSL